MVPYPQIPTLPLFGSFAISSFGVLVATAILVGSAMTHRRSRKLGLLEDDVRSMIFWVVLIGLIMAHVLDIVFYPNNPAAGWDKARLLSLLDPRSGLSSMGGFIGAIIGLFAWCRYHKQAVLPYADSLAYGLSFGWIFGRLGCFTAHDHPGKISNFFLAVAYPCEKAHCGITSNHWFITQNNHTVFPRHDLGFEEALFAIGLSLLFLIVERFRPRKGIFVALIALIYGPVRFCLDFLRIVPTNGEQADPRYFGLTPAQYVAILVFAVGVCLLVYVLQNRSLEQIPALEKKQNLSLNQNNLSGFKNPANFTKHKQNHVKR